MQMHASRCGVLNSTPPLFRQAQRPTTMCSGSDGRENVKAACSAAASEIYDRISGSDHLFPRRRLLRWTRRASASASCGEMASSLSLYAHGADDDAGGADINQKTNF